MRLVVVPNELRDAINAAIDEAIKDYPSLEEERENLFNYLLDYYDENEELPDFTIKMEDL